MKVIVNLRVEVEEADVLVLTRAWLNHEPSMVTIDTNEKPVSARVTYVKER